ncbi:MAG: hypothetical protein JXB15_05225 [Anaerolineales bacterium]|nr:hypothetical protein [Anaerolineales bacterium]
MKNMMMDERTERINGWISFFILMLTHIALAGTLMYKRYILGLPSEAYSDISLILLFSMGGYWAFRLYLSGILPVISWQKMVVIYFVLVLAISIPTYLIVGWPAPGRWFEVLYPAIGVAVVMTFYTLIAYFGKRRLEKMISE